MIDYNYETDFKLNDEKSISKWISDVITEEGKSLGEINYIFCDDEYLHKINIEFLQHDTYTDIISFDYTLGNTINGDIYISIDRVKENSTTFKTGFINELHRVMIHGVLHYLGYKDKTDDESLLMRQKETFYINKTL